MEFIKWFSELSNKDVAVAGGKGASLAEMYNLKIPVPPGFVVTAQAYITFLETTGIGEEIKKVISGLDVNDTKKLNEVSEQIRKIIESAELPAEIADDITEAYEILDAEKKDGDALNVLDKKEEPFVAVRSSATTEDLADASFAGQQDSFLNVRGKENLLKKVKECMSSLFTARAIYYREKKGFDHGKSYLAVVVQKMIDSKKSGVIFSQNPTRADKSIIIEAVWGLGEGIVSGRIKPDHYVISSELDDLKILDMEIAEKKIAVVRGEDGGSKTVNVNEEEMEKQVLTNYEIKRLGQFAKTLEEHYGKPQDVEFAIDDSGIYIVQSRPITTSFKEGSVDGSGEVSGEVLISGLGASPGIASGIVRIVKNESELESVRDGDVLVTEMTNPDMVVTMQRAAAIVTDEGGVTSHAAIVSREMGIPAVVGTGDATKKLKDGDVITVNGNLGKVTEGRGETKLVKIEPVVPTKTEIKVIVDLPEAAERAAKTEVKGIGLMRLEGLIAVGGKHPLKFSDDGNMEPYTKILSGGIKKIMSYFDEVWIRTSDIRSDEFRKLEGAPQKVEGNPMLGDHGVRFSLKHRNIMKAELEAVKEAADAFPDKTFGIMMPQVISVEDVRETKKIAREVGIPGNIKIGIMVETPAAVQIINDLCEEGIAFVSFGTNDLTQYTLAIDRNNEEVQDLYNEMHPAVLNSMSYVIRRCKKSGVKTSICGQAGSREDMVKFLVGLGIDSISVNADAAGKISRLVRKLEGGGSVEEVRVDEEKQEGVSVENVIPERPQINVPVLKTSEGIIGSADMEDLVLKELEDDYVPGDANGTGKKDIPPLNEAIPVGSEMFDNGERKEKIGDSNEISEESIEENLKEELGEEWKGEGS